jgi:hypothetical protein
MSGETKITPGYVFNEQEGERLSLEKLNRIARDMVVQVLAGSIGTGELADKAVTADKLDADVEAQLGVAKGSVTTGALADGFILPISKGGTSASTADTARESLGIKDEILTLTAAQITMGAGEHTHVLEEKMNLIDNCSISSGNLILPAGTYHFQPIACTSYTDNSDRSGTMILRIYVDNEILVTGNVSWMNCSNDSTGSFFSKVDEIITITEETEFVFKTYCTLSITSALNLTGHIRKLHV